MPKIAPPFSPRISKVASSLLRRRPSFPPPEIAQHGIVVTTSRRPHVLDKQLAAPALSNLERTRPMSDTPSPQRPSRTIPMPLETTTLPPPGTVLPVSLLVSSARLLIERHLGLVWVSGEISNFTRAASGHCYFNLKDAQAQARCVFFRQKAQHVGVRAARRTCRRSAGDAVLYEARGEFQLNVENVRLAGIGALYEQFAQLKAKLDAAGWFAADTQASASGVSAPYRRRDVDAGGRAARHPHHAAPSLAGSAASSFTRPPCRARARRRKSRGRYARPTTVPRWTC